MKTDKNILCLSWCDADNVVNYGQILQALAMMKLLRECTSGKIKYVSYFPRGIKGKIKYIIEHLNLNNGHLLSYIKTKKIISRIIRENNINFFQIQNQDIPSRVTKNVDIFVCGSDQIWHPQNFNENFFLAFGDQDSKRISYAASLPKTHIESQFEKQYGSMKNRLQNFDFISVREQSSVEFISNLSSKDVVSVMDPTLLVPVDFWEGMIEEIKMDSRFIFVYIPNGMDEDMAKMITEISYNLQIDTVLVMITRGKNLLENAKVLNFVSLGQFLYLIKNAQCVLTSSFHAVVFSSIFHTNFYTYDVPNNARGEDVRLTDILETLGLENRKISLDKSVNYQNIDFSLVDNRIKEKSEISFNILKENIE